MPRSSRSIGAFRLLPVMNVNALSLNELGSVSPSVTQGTTRYRTFATLQEWFGEYKLADLSPNYDFIRSGPGPSRSSATSWFRVRDTNRAVRLFGTTDSGRTSSTWPCSSSWKRTPTASSNTFGNRHQLVGIANTYIQDCLFPGYTTQFNVVYDHDEPTFKFDKNGFLVRPEPYGVFTLTDRCLLPGLDRRRAHRRLQLLARVLLCLRLRHAQRPRQSSPRTSTPVGGVELIYDRDYDPLPDLGPVLLPATATSITNMPRLRHRPGQSQLRRRPVQLLAEPGDRPVRHQPEEPRQLHSGPALRAKSRARPTSSTRAWSWSTPASTSTSAPS